MPAPSQSLSAVVVSGGKQYRVALGDRILVDRLAAEPGSELTLDRVLLIADGDDVKIGAAATDGLTVTARVLGDRRGKKVEVLRYKSKKNVRVHRGARAGLTALEILTIAGQGAPAKPEKVEKVGKPAARSKAKAAPKAEVAEEPKVEAAAEVEAPVEEVEAPKPARRTRAKAEPKAEVEDKPKKEKPTDGA